MGHGRELIGYGAAMLAGQIGMNVQAGEYTTIDGFIIRPIRCAGG